MIQKSVRGWLQRRRFLRMKQAAVTIQQYCRGQRAVRYALLPDQFTCCSGAPEGVRKVKLSKSALCEFGSVVFM